MVQSILIYGGSFDPVHYGHLYTAHYVQQHMQFDKVLFLPCNTPVLKAPTQATAQQRLAMLQLALATYPDFSIDTRELNRTTPSFMVDTLQSLRSDYGQECAITLLLGQDAFQELPRWHAWQDLLRLCHLLVIERACTKISFIKPLALLIKKHSTNDKQLLLNETAGRIYFCNAGKYAISSTKIRANVQQKQDISQDVPSCVADYIKLYRLYEIPAC